MARYSLFWDEEKAIYRLLDGGEAVGTLPDDPGFATGTMEAYNKAHAYDAAEEQISQFAKDCQALLDALKGWRWED